MTVQFKSLTEKLKNRLSDVKGSCEVVRTASVSIAEVIKEVKTQGKSSVEMLLEMRLAIDKAIEGVVLTRGDLASAVYGLVLGMFKGIRLNGEGLKAVRTLATVIIKSTAKAKGDVAEAARGLIEGIVDQAKPLGLNTSESVSEAATAAVHAAYDINISTGEKVRNALSGTVSGIKIILKEPLIKNEFNQRSESILTDWDNPSELPLECQIAKIN